MDAMSGDIDDDHDLPALRRPSTWDARFAPVMLHAPLVVIALFSYWLTDDPSTTLYISGAFAFVTYLALAAIETRRAPLWLSPLSFFFLWYSVELGPAAIHYAAKIADAEPIKFSVKIIHPDDFAPGYLVFLVGSFALHAGMQATRPLPERWDPQPPPGSASSFFILWAIGMSVRLFGHLVGGFGAIVGMVHWGSLAALSAYAITRGGTHRHTMSFWAVLAAGTIIEFASNLRSGSKAYLMYSFLPVIWMFVRERALRRWMPVLGATLALLYLGVIAPVVNASRYGPAAADDTPADRIIRTYTEGDYGESASVSGQAEHFFERGFEPTPVAFLYSEVERAGLRYGETMEYLAYAFVPRVFWEDKPGVSRGAWFNSYLGAAAHESESTTSVGQTATGELYWNFGIAGVILGLGVIGALFGLLWRLATLHPERDPVRQLLYISLTFSMIDMSEAGSTLVGLTYRAVVLGPALFLLDRAARQKAQA
ncbi:hypothetical protein [Polyangium aurulentum]|uniref:hypothetical protein n=1 Tax=Polyangium aurulentum TaxID=2567896 RepID=UPI0010AE7B1F|nr:hypothetical protein [Polyangium aurulentum]UQA62384.1 hypothetical protein E8A73_018765 [Polyangium aurulentum]